MILNFAVLALALLETTGTPPEAPKEKKICRVEQPTTGSRMSQGRRVCRTAAEWELERLRTEDDADRVKSGANR